MSSLRQLRHHHCDPCGEQMLFDAQGCTHCRKPYPGQPTFTATGRFNPLRSLYSEIQSRRNAGERSRVNARNPARGDALGERGRRLDVRLTTRREQSRRLWSSHGKTDR